MGSYIPSTTEEKEEMLRTVGVANMEELFQVIPREMKIGELNIPSGKSELEVSQTMREIAGKNKVFPKIFRGAGAYNHYIPSIVKSVAGKEEFMTSYTPYQAEISQGILQSIFEFQTMICELTGMDVSNASVYDGATAAAESVTMCLERKKNKMLISGSSHPMTIQTMRTYCEGHNTELEVIPVKDGKTDTQALHEMLGKEIAGVYIQQPNYYGLLEDAEEIGSQTHASGSKFVMGIHPIAGMLLKSPQECGADVAVGEGQPLGLPLSFGGPYLGFMACTETMMRKLPGRVVGETTDVDGKRAYVLTLQAREQHIRREKASSNICSNQALCALTASVYMTAMGAEGMTNAAELCYSKAHYAAEKISSINGFPLRYEGDFFHEFLTEVPCDPEMILEKLEERGILGGLPVERGILWCVTEVNTKEQIDELAEVLKEVCERCS